MSVCVCCVCNHFYCDRWILFFLIWKPRIFPYWESYIFVAYKYIELLAKIIESLYLDEIHPELLLNSIQITHRYDTKQVFFRLLEIRYWKKVKNIWINGIFFRDPTAKFMESFESGGQLWNCIILCFENSNRNLNKK